MTNQNPELRTDLPTFLKIFRTLAANSSPPINPQTYIRLRDLTLSTLLEDYSNQLHQTDPDNNSILHLYFKIINDYEYKATTLVWHAIPDPELYIPILKAMFKHDETILTRQNKDGITLKDHISKYMKQQNIPENIKKQLI